MQIDKVFGLFGSGHITIIVFAVCFVLLLAVGIYFAVKGVRTASGEAEESFVDIRKLESAFVKAGKRRENRCVLYISVSSDNFCGLDQEQRVFGELKTILLRAVSVEANGFVAPYGDKNFVALADWDARRARDEVEDWLGDVNRCLLKNSALNIVDIRVGLFFARGTETSFEESVNRAKQACMLAKNGQQLYAQWDASSGKALEQRIQIENSIESEIDNNRFYLEYQPILEAGTMKIMGAEVLARLNSEHDGLLGPGKFLSAVDSVGLNGKFDYYIFEKNCKWIANNRQERDGYIYSINFSRSTMCDPFFAGKIINTAWKYGLPFSCIAVEVLEDRKVTGKARERLEDNLTALKEKGISILLDDFGSGYTTFDDLQSLDVSIVKIDRNITRNSVTETGRVILENIVRTAKGIGLKTLCEGVETEEEEYAAIQAGCDYLQGFRYYKPMSVTALEELLKGELGGA